MANILINGTPFASSDRSGSFPASNAVDGNLATRWATNDGGVPGWWAYDLGSSVSKAVLSVSYYLASSELPNAFTIDYSDDSLTWVTLLAATGINSASTWITFQIPTFRKARYWRMKINTVYSGVVASLSEIQMQEWVYRGPTTPPTFGLPRGGR